jgi:hypothetical protein
VPEQCQCYGGTLSPMRAKGATWLSGLGPDARGVLPARDSSLRRRLCCGMGLAAHSLFTLLALLLLTACGSAGPTPTGTPAPPEQSPLPTATIERSPTATPFDDDPNEPNDSMLEAAGPLVPGQEYQGFISAKDDLDFFFLEIETPQIIDLSLTGIPQDADYDLYLVTGEEDVLADSANSGLQEEHIQYTTSSVGVFYVLVLPFNNFSDTEPYTLRLELSPAPTPSGEDTFEPNDTPEEAAGPLAWGQAYRSYIWDEGDVDVYFLQLDRASSILVSLTNITAVADYDLFLYDQSGGLVASSTRAVDRELVEQSLQPGTYYVTVKSFVGFSQNNPYTLQIDLVEP